MLWLWICLDFKSRSMFSFKLNMFKKIGVENEKASRRFKRLSERRSVSGWNQWKEFEEKLHLALNQIEGKP